MNNILFIKKKQGLIYIFLFLLSIKSWAQNEQLIASAVYNRPNDIFYGTPDVTAFQKYSFSPVNLYTGRVDVTIPIYTIKTGKFTIPITISYNGGNGIKVDDVPSSVGAGWNINAGGNIIRVVKDLDDFDYKPSSYAESDWDIGCIAHYYVAYKGFHIKYAISNGHRTRANDSISAFSSCMSDLGGLSYQNYTYEDARPDEFIINAPMLHSRFHTIPLNENPDINQYKGITKDGSPINITGQTQVFNYTHLQGEAIDKVRDYTSFTVVNSDGIEYNFDKYDKSLKLFKSQKYYPTSLFFGEQKIESWNLSKMTDKQTNQSIIFEYEEYQKPIETYRYNTKDIYTERANPYLFKNTTIYGGHVDLCTYGFIPQFDLNTSTEDLQYFKASRVLVFFEKAQRLKKIKWAGGSINFTYTPREDVYQEKYLLSIDIKDHTETLVKKYNFQYSYKKSKENCSQENCSRLFLNQISLVSASSEDQINYYSFEYNATPLPKRNSLEQDYLGYYNHNGVATPAEGSLDVVSPTLYYYPNKGKYSILPFPLQGETSGYSLPGNYSLLPNENSSQAGILTKITYPTGGWNEFEYENHKFTLFNKEYTSPGLRLRKQKINNGDGQVHEYSYKYENGMIGSIPIYGYPWAISLTNTDLKSFVVYDKLKSGLELTQNSFVGYSKVIEKEEGKGYKEYVYSNFNDFPNEYEEINMENDIYFQPFSQCGKLLRDNSAFFQQNYEDFDVRRGNKLKESIYNNNNTLIKQSNYKYDYKLLKEEPMKYVKTYSYFILYPTDPPVDQTRMKSNLKIHRNLLSETETTEYLENGPLVNTIKYTYHTQYPLVYEEIKDGGNSTEKMITRYRYPIDFTTNPFLQKLVTKNQINTPITVETLQKEEGIEKQLSYTESQYGEDLTTALFVLPQYIYTKKGDAVLEKKISYDKYDDKGNLLQYTLENGTPVSIIWGYNQQYPVAKIEGIGYNQMLNGGGNIADIINAIQGQTSVYPENQEFHLNLMNQLRVNSVLQNTMVTTYTYKPLIGVNTLTSPNGLTEYYVYDSFGRLKQIKDKDGKILKSFEYHYKQ